jgi:WD40 repeat protein
MASDDEGEFLFVGEKNGSIKIWNMGAGTEGDTLKQTINIDASLNALSFETKFFTLISLATSNGLAIRDIKGNQDIFIYPPVRDPKDKDAPKQINCLSLAFDQSSNFYNFYFF